MEILLSEQRPRALSFLPRALFEPQRTFRYVLIAWALTTAGALALAPIARLLAGDATPQFPAWSPLKMVLMLVIYAPILETLIMGTLLLVLERFLGFLPAVLLSSAGWGIAHSLEAPAWGLVIWWPFLIFSIVFLTWRKRSLGAAFALPMLVHGLQNLGPALLMVSGLNS